MKLFLHAALAVALAAAAQAKPPHWAFTAPARPAVPAASAWAATPIDAFVLSKLKTEKLAPSPEAEKTILLRRLSLDLIGLPPSIDEIDAFLADKRPGAYTRQVERLLASPHYGERWGRLWLDAARYADSDGFEKDKPRFIWPYRDWVVRAFNDDLPYDQFVIKQVAGDELPNPTQDDLVATGFLRNSMLNEEGGADPEQFRSEEIVDRMDAIGKSILGLTVQCAQCHDHKFDPISREEYYRMFAYLNNDHESSIVVYAPEEQKQRDSLAAQMRSLEMELQRTNADWPARMAAWEDSTRNDQPQWTPLRCENAGDNGERFYYYSDDSIRAGGYAPTKWTSEFTATSAVPVIGAFRLEQLTDPELPCGGPGRSIKGMSALTEFKVTAKPASGPEVNVKFARATADFSNREKDLEAEFNDNSGKKRVYGPVEYAIDGKDDTAWGIDAGPGRRNQSRKAVFIPDKPLAFTNAVKLTFRLELNHGGWNSDDNENHNLGRFRISVSGATNAVADPLPADVREIVQTPAASRTPAQITAVFSYWRTTVPAFKSVNDKIEALWRKYPEGTPSLVLRARHNSGPGDERRVTHILTKGDWLKLEKAVEPGVPKILHPLPAGADGSRLTFARWLADPRSPTTARVFANRLWQAYFGGGLLETPEDFGTRAPDPSHPKLLDWLAVEFMRPAVLAPGESSLAPPWDVKHIQRLIVESATYRQSSRATPALVLRDPKNHLLARGARFRVDAEIVRDIALDASGLLDAEVGGPPVTPPAPNFLFQIPASYGPKIWPDENGPERYRRALYTFRFRSVPYPMLQTFDAPVGDGSCVRRMRSNTPLQALVSLNEPVFVECAQALARRCLEHGASDAEHIRYGFRCCLARGPEPREIKALADLLRREKSYVGEGWVDTAALGHEDAGNAPPKGASPTELAAYTVVARVLLNLDETITRE
ncbi:MAG TPA: DUF1549 and DUF1553 domain-containing protein [Verrucomicrobiae bacterium]|jgi:hypothetical protein